MEISIVLIALGALIFCSHIFNSAFSKTRIPNVLFLMIIGLLVGPIFGWVSPSDLGKVGSVFTTVTLICILFQSGTSLDLKTLYRSIGPAFFITVLNFIVMMAIGVILGLLTLKLNVIQSCFLGAALGGTSSAVVIPMVNQLKPSDKAGTILYLESALSDIICLVVAMTLLEGFDTGAISVGAIFEKIGTSMLFATLLGVASGFIWIIILKIWLKNMSNSMFTTFALAFIVYGVTEQIGLNGGMAILAFGLAVANFHRIKNSEFASLNENEKNFYSEIVFILQTYFFVYIGISFSFNNVYHLIIGAVFVALVFLSRIVTCSTISKGFDARDKRLMWILGPKGLVAAVLTSLPLQWATATHASQEMIQACQTIQDIGYAVVLFNIIACSVIIMLTERKSAPEIKEETIESPLEVEATEIIETPDSTAEAETTQNPQ